MLSIQRAAMPSGPPIAKCANLTIVLSMALNGWSTVGGRHLNARFEHRRTALEGSLGVPSDSTSRLTWSAVARHLKAGLVAGSVKRVNGFFNLGRMRHKHI